MLRNADGGGGSDFLEKGAIQVLRNADGVGGV